MTVYMKTYYLNHKEDILANRKEYYKKNRDKVLKRTWIRRGLILKEDETWEGIFDRYNNSTRCEICDCEYIGTNVKCMEHSHITGHLRNIACKRCNNKIKKLT